MRRTLQQLETAIKRKRAERNGPHTMVDDLAFHLDAFDKEIADLERQAKAVRAQKKGRG